MPGPIDPDRLFNVIPDDDLLPHREGVDCPCRPTVEQHEDGETWIVHQAWDCREYFEA